MHETNAIPLLLGFPEKGFLSVGAMGRPTKRTQPCRELVRKRRKPADSLYNNTVTDNAFINDNCYFADDAIEDESSEFEVYEWNDNRLDYTVV